MAALLLISQADLLNVPAAYEDMQQTVNATCSTTNTQSVWRQWCDSRCRQATLQVTVVTRQTYQALSFNRAMFHLWQRLLPRRCNSGRSSMQSSTQHRTPHTVALRPARYEYLIHNEHIMDEISRYLKKILWKYVRRTTTAKEGRNATHYYQTVEDNFFTWDNRTAWTQQWLSRTSC